MAVVSNITDWILVRLTPRTTDPEDGDLVRRTRFAVICMLTMTTVAVVAMLRFLLFGHTTGVLVWNTVVLLVGVTAFLFRRTGSLPLVAISLCTILAAAITSMAWSGGGLGMPGLYGLGLLPLIATLIAGTRMGVSWTLVSALVAAFYIALHLTDSEPTTSLSPASMKQLHSVGIVLILGFIAILAIVYEVFKQRALTEMALARAEADRASRAKSEFLAHMSHELRNPMNGVIGLTSLLRETHDDDERERLLSALLTSSETMKSLLDELLDLSKIEAGKLTLERVPFSLQELTGNVVTLMEPSAIAKGLTLSWHASDEVPGLVEGDPTRVSQVLLNLVNNAIKFTDTGSVEVRLSVAAGSADASSNRATVCMTVRDTGPGMTTETIDRVFGEFFQADASTTRNFGGTGLGLTIARHLCELMNGSIEVASRVGHGSTFTAQVQLSTDRDLQAKLDRGIASEQLIEPSSLRGLRALIVDDNPINRMVLSRMLESLGGHADQVSDGAAAIEAVRLNDYDCVLMDCKMSGMNGMQAATAIRSLEVEHASAIPIIAVTASAMPHERANILDSGMNDVLLKPIARRELQSVLLRFLTPS